MTEETRRPQDVSGERHGSVGSHGGSVKHGTAETPVSNGRQGSEAPVNPRHGGGSSVGGR